jgi:hypothetical protein
VDDVRGNLAAGEATTVNTVVVVEAKVGVELEPVAPSFSQGSVI